MTDTECMAEALDQARRAGELGEVPIGAVIVLDDRVIGRGHNEVETRGLVTAHAEIKALEEAARTIGDWRLDGAAVYATVEPCHMCLGALHLARVERLVFGAKQPRSGACGSIDDLVERGLYGHRIKSTGGVLEEESLLLLQEFFTRLRNEEK